MPDSRSSLLTKNVMASFLIKGWSAAIVYLMVPLTLKMLGEYNNGVWLTISGILVWIDMLDIGLGNGLRNAVSQYIAEGKTQKVREAISSTFFMLALIVLPIIAIIAGIVMWGDIYSWLGFSNTIVPNLRPILIVAATLVCMAFIFKTIGNVYMGLQLPAVNNLLLCLGQTLALIGTFMAYTMGSHSLFVVVLLNTLLPLSVWILSFPYTFWHRYPQYRPTLSSANLAVAKALCSTGVQFFVIQICSVVLFASTNIIISRMFSPTEVTPYQVAYRYFSIMLVFFTIVCMPFWNATTDAYTRGDMPWIHRASRRLNIMLLGIAIGMAIMVAVSPTVYHLWVGDDVNVPMSLSAAMACYLLILIVSMRYSYFLNGIGILLIQLIFTVIATIAFLPLAIWACDEWHNVTTLVWVMCLVNTPGLIANIWKFNKVV